MGEIGDKGIVFNWKVLIRRLSSTQKIGNIISEADK